MLIYAYTHIKHMHCLYPWIIDLIVYVLLWYSFRTINNCDFITDTCRRRASQTKIISKARGHAFGFRPRKLFFSELIEIANVFYLIVSLILVQCSPAIVNWLSFFVCLWVLHFKRYFISIYSKHFVCFFFVFTSLR